MRKSRIVVLLVYTMLTLCWSNYNGIPLYAQDSATTEKDSTAEKEEKDAKKDLKFIEKLLSFKNFFHHSDSTKLAKRYIRQHQRLTRGKKNYRYKIPRDSLINLLPYLRYNINEPTHEILGWYPSWEKDLHKTLNYSLLSTVAYFSYEVNPKTGEADSIGDWMTTPVIDSLHAHNKKILLTVTNFGNKENREFLKNPAAGDTLIKRVIQLLKDRDAHGVCIDFEGVVKSQKKNFNSFITLFSQELKKANKEYLVYLTVPAVDWNKYLDFEVLIPVVDQFAIMGYDYYGSTSKVAGPAAPLQSGDIWDPFNLTTSVDYYLANKIPPSQLILALPFYGNLWNTKTGQRGSKSDKYIGARSYDYIKYEFDKVPEIEERYDSISQSAWYSYVIKSDAKKPKRQFRQLWFDSDSTMAVKLNFIKERNLNGLGIWALGYNKKYKNYWKVIDETFCRPEKDSTLRPYILKYPDSIVVVVVDTTALEKVADSTKTDTTKTEDETDIGGDDESSFWESLGGFWDTITDVNGILKKISESKWVLLYALLFMVFFGGIGFVIAMFKPDTRKFFFNSRTYTFYYVLVVLGILVFCLRYIRVIKNDPTVVLIGGFVIGAIVIYYISRRVQKAKRDLP